ncbi:MAG: hypothetical protein WC047_08905 [Kiritimatiellales bacterium]
MATTRVKRTLSIYRQEGKDGVIVDKTSAVGEAASGDWLAGAPLEYTAGTIEDLATGGADTGKVIGIAVKNATGTTGAAVPYYEANDYNLFEGSLVDGTGDHVLAASDIGAIYGLIDAGGAGAAKWYVDYSNTTQDKVVIVGCVDPIGDTNARVIFRFIGGMQARVLQS